MKKFFLIFVFLIVVLACGIAAYLEFSKEHEDLELLAPYAETERLDKLIAQVQATPPDDEGFSFVVLGDSRSFYDVAKKVFLQAATEKPAFILGNGDIVRRGRVEEYISHHLQLVKQIKPIPFITAAGNHEEGPNKDFAAFKALYGDTRFSFDYGNCRFVGISNNSFFDMTRDNLDYLEKELSKPGVAHKFVVFHVPPDNLDVYVGSEEGRGFRWRHDEFYGLMATQKVDHVFMGHVHGYATTEVQGVKYTITGGAGANLADQLPVDGQVHNYVVVHVKKGGLEYEVVRLIGDSWQRSGR